MSDVEYRAVPGSPGYRVGSDGSVWTCKVTCSKKVFPWRRMSTQKDRYETVVLRVENAARKRTVHSIVLEAFVGPRPGGMEACHFPDRNKLNNALTNLRWDTKEANQADGKIQGTNVLSSHPGELHGQSKLTASEVLKIRSRRELGETYQSIASDFGVRFSTIEKIVKRQSWKHI